MQISSGPGSEDVRVMIKNNVEDPGRPRATTVVFSTSLWLKVSPSRLFNFLRHDDSRNKVCSILPKMILLIIAGRVNLSFVLKMGCMHNFYFIWDQVHYMVGGGVKGVTCI